MKKALLLSALLIMGTTFFYTSAEAQTDTKNPEQDHHASWFVGGMANYWYNTDTRTNQLHLHPEFGYFLNDTWAVGLIAGYGFEQTAEETTSTISTEHELTLSPFVRYYYCHRGPFNLYVDGNIGYNFTKTDGGAAQHGIEVGLRPGACLDLTEGLCLCLHMGFVGFRHAFHGEEPSLPDSGWGISFTPEHLLVGIELEF